VPDPESVGTLDHAKNDFVRLELGSPLGVAGYATRRTTRLRSMANAVVVLVLGVRVARVANALIGH